ncbi:MAG: hypothetical protein LQ341_004544 [Variospora aurantia]|nr:MAG: hypothetical protein LQ341_004544 [Variospora aurantia]
MIPAAAARDLTAYGTKERPNLIKTQPLLDQILHIYHRRMKRISRKKRWTCYKIERVE